MGNTPKIAARNFLCQEIESICIYISVTGSSLFRCVTPFKSLARAAAHTSNHPFALHPTTHDPGLDGSQATQPALTRTTLPRLPRLPRTISPGYLRPRGQSRQQLDHVPGRRKLYKNFERLHETKDLAASWRESWDQHDSATRAFLALPEKVLAMQKFNHIKSRFPCD
jgi:hypothetical protein